MKYLANIAKYSPILISKYRFLHQRKPDVKIDPCVPKTLPSPTIYPAIGCHPHLAASPSPSPSPSRGHQHA